MEKIKDEFPFDEILKSAKNALRILLDEAEKRNFDPPVPSEVVAELEFIIACFE